MCRMHYSRLRRTGSVHLSERTPLRDVECSVDGCDSPAFCRSWCRKHYTRWYETGSLELGVRTGDRSHLRKPLSERFWKYVDVSPSHWWWTGTKTKLGYGMIWDYNLGRSVMAHRASWELAHGEQIPDFLVIDHLCRQPSCVNPDHLEVVTFGINTERGMAPVLGGTRQRSKTHCPQGHPYSEENTYLYKNGRKRVCRTCAIERTQARRERLRKSHGSE